MAEPGRAHRRAEPESEARKLGPLPMRYPASTPKAQNPLGQWANLDISK